MERLKEHEHRLWNAYSLLLVLALAAFFYVPALERTGGLWPAPLDDVYIYFDFAKSAAQGHPFEWIAGNGYSSGSTSVIYPFLLTIGYWIGFRGAHLGIFAALLSCACLFDMCRSARALVISRSPLSAWFAPPLLLSVPLLDWSFYSGMETALFAALLGRALIALMEAEQCPAHRRAQAQWKAGLYAALLVASRPETLCFSLPMSIFAVYSARSLSLLGSLGRALFPTAAFLGGYSIVNRIFTSEWAAAGAVRKLLTSNPYAAPLDIIPEFLRNIFVLRSAALDHAMGQFPFSLLVPALGLSALLSKRFRRAAVALWIGALGSLLLVSLNVTARYQNFRYAAPSILMLLFLALFGVAGQLGRLHFKRIYKISNCIAIAALWAAIVASARFFPAQVRHFARASRNIAQQQVEVGLRLSRWEPRPRLILLGDAGAIPYVSGIRALDGLGLGGYRGLPFARASVHGNFAVVELIERLAPGDRPDVMALYPLWWPDVIRWFGHRVDSVKVDDNVILGADEKVMYTADWSTLHTPSEPSASAGALREIDEIDIADLQSEREHAYAGPFPMGGWVIGDVRPLPWDSQARRFDGGRILPQGRDEWFSISNSVELGPASLVLRTDEGYSVIIQVELWRRGERTERIEWPVPSHPIGSNIASNAWIDMNIPLREVGGGDRIRILSLQGSFRHFHAWLVRRRLGVDPSPETVRN